MNHTTRVFFKGLGLTKKLRFVTVRCLDMLIQCIGKKDHFNTTYSFFNKLQEHGVSVVDKQQRYCLGYEGKNFLVRKNSSDEQVFVDVVLNGEYDALAAMAASAGIPVRSVIDAGANAGMTTLVFASRFPDAEIISLEPDPDNFLMLSDNVQMASLRRVRMLEGGLGPTDGWLVPAKGMDEREWGKAFSFSDKALPGSVAAYSVRSIIGRTGWDGIDILKMDIEGGEREVFRSAEIDFLLQVKLLAVEIHDQDEKMFIHTLLKNKGFFFFEDKGLTLAINSRCIPGLV